MTTKTYDTRACSYFSHVRLLATSKAPLSMRFSRQEYWSRLPFPPPGCLPNPGSNPCLLHFLYWQEGSLPMGKLAKTVEPTSEFSCGWMRKLEGLSTNSYLSLFEAYLCGVNVLIFLAPLGCDLSTLCCQHNHSGKQMLGAMVYKRTVSRFRCWLGAKGGR